MDTPLDRPGSTTTDAPPTPWLTNWTGQLSKARERTAQLRTIGEAGALDDRGIAIVHELQLTYEELSVAEEELRSQNEQLAEAVTVIHAERERYRQLFKEAPVAYFVTDETGMIRDANLAASHLTRCPIEFLAGKPLVVFTRHDSRRKLRAMLLRLHHGDASAVASFELTTRKDSVIQVDATAHAMATAAHGSREIRWLFVDERPRRRRERMARERSVLLDGLVAERTAELERAHHVKDQLIATVSHELRTPLAAIAGFTELLSLGARGSLSDEQQEDVRRIHGAYEHMTRVVDDLLNYNKLAAGTLALEMNDVVIGDQLRAVTELMAYQAVDRGIVLTSDDLVGTQTVRADPDRLRQILLNLVGNAVKYTPSGGTVHVRATSMATDVLIEIEDNGPGVPPSEQASIFDPFIRLSRDTATQGSGLGLAISREMARAMGGDVTLASDIDSGSCFSVRLPFSTRLASE